MSDLINKFKSLPRPKSAGAVTFAAVPARDSSPHRIGKDSNGCPCILIALKEGAKESFPGTSLRNINVVYDLECQISQNGLMEEGAFTIMTFTGEDPGLQDSFLRFCEVILDSLGNAPNKKDVAATLDRCVRLFKNITKPPKKTIHGLWSELFFMTISDDPAGLVKAWHVNMEDKCDFNMGKRRYEIKSSSSRLREHYFTQDQLSPPEGTEVIIVSMFTEATDTGKSIGDLVQQLKQRLGNQPRLVEKIMTLCYETLGNSLDDSFNLRFDTILALSSIAAYTAAYIPHIRLDDIPAQVTAIKYKVNLEGLASDNSLLPFIK
jgi:hypothetical protein